MITCGELATFFRASAARCDMMLSEVVVTVVESGVERAKSYIGRQQADWSPLSGGTLKGFRHHNGRWIYGKEASGFAPPDNDLLRSGDMRGSIEGRATGLMGEVGSDSKTALWQELGTEGAEYPIPARPFLAKAVEASIPEVTILLEEVAVKLLVPGRA